MSIFILFGEKRVLENKKCQEGLFCTFFIFGDKIVNKKNRFSLEVKLGANTDKKKWHQSQGPSACQ